MKAVYKKLKKDQEEEKLKSIQRATILAEPRYLTAESEADKFRKRVKLLIPEKGKICNTKEITEKTIIEIKKEVSEWEKSLKEGKNAFDMKFLYFRIFRSFRL